MEGIRNVALADYENLPDEVKANIHKSFKRTVAQQNVSEYFKVHHEARSEIVDKWLETCKGYRRGSLDFDDFVTLRYILEHLYVVICDGCSSMIFGGAYFSCFECFFNYPKESYDLCCGCYGSKKFQNHNHVEFYDNQTLQYLSRRVFSEMRNDRDKRVKFIDKAMIDFASDFMECAKSIKTDGWENYFDRVLNFDKNHKLGEICNHAKELEEMPSAKESPTESAIVAGLNENINLSRARAKELEGMPSAKENPTESAKVAGLNENINLRAANAETTTVPSTESRRALRRVDLFEPNPTPMSNELAY